jgi:hypothetical protein
MGAHVQTRSLVLLALGYGAGTLVALDLVGPFVSWEGQGVLMRLLTIYLMPITATAILLLLRSLQRRHAPANGDPLGDEALQRIVFWILFFLVGVHVLMMAVLTRTEAVWPWAQRGVIVLLGVSLAAIGNLMPRTRPNFALGIRTARTLTDRQLWMLTHRTLGYTVVAVGVVTILSGLFMHGTAVAAAPFIGLVMAATVVAVYYVRLTAGDAGEAGEANPSN